MIPWILAATLVAANAGQPSEARLVDYVEQLPSQRIDSLLPAQPFGAWLAAAVGPDAKISWEADDCAEGGDHEGATPICVAASCQLWPHGRATVSIIVGSTAKGIVGRPGLWWASIEGVGPSVDVTSLPMLRKALEQARATEHLLARLPDHRLSPAEAFEAVRRAPARTLSPNLPDEPFGRWLDRLAGSDSLHWELWNCVHGQLGKGLDEWADVDISFRGARAGAGLEIRVGTCAKGIVGVPAVRSVRLEDKRPGHASLRRIALDSLSTAIEAIRR